MEVTSHKGNALCREEFTYYHTNNELIYYMSLAMDGHVTLISQFQSLTPRNPPIHKYHSKICPHTRDNNFSFCVISIFHLKLFYLKELHFEQLSSLYNLTRDCTTSSKLDFPLKSLRCLSTYALCKISKKIYHSKVFAVLTDTHDHFSFTQHRFSFHGSAGFTKTIWGT